MPPPPHTTVSEEGWGTHVESRHGGGGFHRPREIAAHTPYFIIRPGAGAEIPLYVSVDVVFGSYHDDTETEM
jgi:hypothetical protein